VEIKRGNTMTTPADLPPPPRPPWHPPFVPDRRVLISFNFLVDAEVTDDNIHDLATRAGVQIEEPHVTPADPEAFDDEDLSYHVDYPTTSIVIEPVDATPATVPITGKRTLSDQAALDQIAIFLGSQEQWNGGDVCEHRRRHARRHRPAARLAGTTPADRSGRYRQHGQPCSASSTTDPEEYRLITADENDSYSITLDDGERLLAARLAHELDTDPDGDLRLNPIFALHGWETELHLPAVAWFWQVNDVWIAVPEEQDEETWFSYGDDPTPTPRTYPIGELPPSGLIAYKDEAGLGWLFDLTTNERREYRL
jgi:hypothetical protein